MSKRKDKSKSYEDKWFKNIEQNWASILYGNALLLPFTLPIIAWLVICQCYSALLGAASQAVGGGMVLMCLGLLPCAEIYAVGLAGAVWLNKCILYDGNMGILKRFAEGIRTNALKYMLFVFLMWLSSSLAMITPALYSLIGNAILFGVGSVVAIGQTLLIIPPMCLAMIQCVFFEDKLRLHLSNAYKLYFIRPFKTIGATLLSMLPFTLCMFLPFIWQLAFWVVYVVVGVSFGLLFRLIRGKMYFDWVLARSDKAQQNNIENN